MTRFRTTLFALLLTFGAAGCSSLPSQTSAAIVGSGTFVSETGESIRADYRDNETVTLTLANGQTTTLDQAVSGSGARYVRGAEEWWEHQGEATLRRNGTVVFSGKLSR